MSSISLNFSVTQLFFDIFPSNLANLLQQAFEIYFMYPEIRSALQADQLSHAQEKKLERLLDREYELSCHETLFELLEADLNPENLSLDTGRPSMSPEVLFAFIVLQGYYGSMEDKRNYESVSRHTDVLEILTRLGQKRFPTGRSIMQNISTVKHSTRVLIHQSQLAYALDLELDDFQRMTPDSTFVKANSAWPTDSSLIYNLLNRVYTMGQKINDRSSGVLPDFTKWHVPRWLNELNSLNFGINITQGKVGAVATRLSSYKEIYRIADLALRHLDKQLFEINTLFERSSFKPSLEKALKRYLSHMQESLEQVITIILYSEDRVVEGAKIPADEKVYSLIDPDAYMICKGQREAVIGYRPTLARTGSGLIGALYLETGNPADTDVFKAVVQTYIEMTGVVPEEICTDGGYASESNYLWSLERGVKLCSFTGSTGRKLMTPELYESAPVCELRNWRSASESTISVMKGSYGLDRMSRRGESAVKNEMLDKVLAHNFMKIVELKMEKELAVAA